MRKWATLVVLVVAISSLAGCMGVTIVNPLVAGVVQPNRVMRKFTEVEDFRQVPRDTFAWGATLMSLDPQRVCFDASVMSLPDSADVIIDIKTAEILLQVDGNWLRGNPPQLIPEELTTRSVPGLVPKRRTVDVLECVERSHGNCVRHAYRKRQRTKWVPGNIEIADSHARICFQNHTITPATKNIRLDINIPTKPADEQTLSDFMQGGAMIRLAYRWALDPKGQGTPGYVMPVAEPTPQQPPTNPGVTTAPPVTTSPPVVAPTSSGDKDIIATIQASGCCSIFLGIVEKVGMTQTLRTGGPYTVFAPPDKAFDKLWLDMYAKHEQETGTEIVKGHMIAELLPMSALASGYVDKATVYGNKIRIETRPAYIRVDTARATKTEIKANNGIVYMVDRMVRR